MVNIALDYDGTYTKDRGLWDNFIADACTRGHTIYMVTMRYPEKEKIEHDVPILVIYTSRKAKMKFMADLKIVIHIWIDDMPHFLFNEG